MSGPFAPNTCGGPSDFGESRNDPRRETVVVTARRRTCAAALQKLEAFGKGVKNSGNLMQAGAWVSFGFEAFGGEATGPVDAVAIVGSLEILEVGSALSPAGEAIETLGRTGNISAAAAGAVRSALLDKLAFKSTS